jgi:alpha-amylase
MRILHCFNWRLEDIISILPIVREQGFDAIQINPIQPLKEDGVQEWWMSYQPVGFSIGNYFGSREDLINLCREAKNNNVAIFADVIVNHMGASVNNPLEPHEKVDEKLRNNPDFWKEKRYVYNWKNREEVIHYCMGLPGLNVYNPQVEDIIVDFLNDLIECGVDGFRFDAAKSIGLPSEGYRFWPNIIYRLKKYGLFLYGEVIFEDNINILNEYSNYMNILGNYDCSNKDKMVKFVESHDSYLSTDNMGYTKKIPSTEIAKYYNDLTKNYNNTLFYIRPYDDIWKNDKIRNANNNRNGKVYTKRCS